MKFTRREQCSPECSVSSGYGCVFGQGRRRVAEAVGRRVASGCIGNMVNNRTAGYMLKAYSQPEQKCYPQHAG